MTGVQTCALPILNLCRLVGLNLQTELHLQDSLTDKIDPRIWALDTSVEQRPDYTMLAQEVDLRKKQVDLTRADFLPQIGVTAGYGYGGGLQLNGDDEASATFSAMAAVKIPVFHWGEGKNKVRSARMEEEISRLNLEKTTDLMRLQIYIPRTACCYKDPNPPGGGTDFQGKGTGCEYHAL